MLNFAFPRVLAALLGLCLLAPASRAADDEMVDNPQYKSWASHKPGSTVTYESSTAVGGQSFKTGMTYKLLEVTPEKAVVEVAIKLDIPGAQAPPAQKQDVPVKVKKSEAAMGKMPEGMKGEMKEKGDEKVTVGGKSYDCKVHEFTGEAQGTKVKGKTWTSEKVPGTMVKMESTANVGGQDMKTTMAVTKIETK